jgi:predicted kinase
MTALTVVGGLPGVGKTTFGKAYAAHTGAALIDRDTLMDPIVNAGLVAGGQQAGAHATSLFLDTFNEPAYAAAENVALEIATSADVNVVLVAPYTFQAAKGRGWWDDLSGRFAAANVDSRLLWIELGPDDHARRLRARAAPRDAERNAAFATWWAAQNRTVPAYAVRLSGALPVDTLVKLAAMRRVPLRSVG